MVKKKKGNKSVEVSVITALEGGGNDWVCSNNNDLYIPVLGFWGSKTRIY